MSQLALPSLTTEQMRTVDRLMIDVYGIALMQMMEHAGQNLALLAKELLDHDLADRPIVLLAGRGNNGGGGLVAARHLLNWGAALPAHQLQSLQAMDAPLAWAEQGWELPPADLVIDALIGYGLQGEPQGKVRELIHLANSSVAPILSLDAPSGLDTTTGALYTPHIHAAATMTLALPKTGLLTPTAQGAVGQLYLADIGVPPALFSALALTVPPLFAAGPLLPVTVVDGVAFVDSTYAA
jgi:NAD(P)H-hydrate epimerase